MRKHSLVAGSLAFALVSGLVATPIAYARDGNSGGQDDDTAVSAAVSDTGSRSAMGSEDSDHNGENRGSGNATSTVRAQEEIGEHAAEQAREHSNSFLFLSLESTTTPAFSLERLREMIQERELELEHQASSTATSTRDIVEHASRVSVAVHALLASRDLLGGIGQDVSDIARQVNESLATTTGAEAQIQSRGFWTQLFFGGDTSAADIIDREVAQNQARITALTQLLGQANVSADVRSTLEAQITAMEQEQARLQALAKQQQGLWGIFSWRF